MSLILEALKKSEAERQRGKAPGLFVEQAVAPLRGRQRTPGWAYALGVLLVVVVALLTMIKHSTVQTTFAAKAKQSHWAAMFSTCSYVGG